MVTDRFLFDGAESLCARTARSAVRTSGSAKAVAVEISAASVEVPSSPASHHQRPAEGNPDASLFVAAHDSAGPARHDCVDREGSLGSVARIRAVCCAGSPRRSLAHSRCCRDRSTNRSGPGRGSGHRDTDAGLHLPVCLRHTDVDESPHRWDTAPAYVPRHVVWGAASKQTSRLGSAPCPVFNRDRHLTHLLPLHHQTHRSSAARRIPIPHHSAPCVQPSKQGDGFSVTRADCARERPIAVLPPAVRSSAAQDAALVPCSEASMRARYRKGCGPLRHE